MSEENKNDTLEDVRIITKISKRIDVIDKTNDQLKKTQKDQLRRLTSQRELQKEEVKKFQNECKKIKDDFRQITKSIFELGIQLKDKVSKDEVEFLEKKVDKWPLEKFITKKELEKTYNHYKKSN